MFIISKFVFGFDIDGVLTNDDDGNCNIWLKEASKYFGEPILKRSYYIEEAFNKSKEEVQEFFKERINTIFSSVPVREHAVETIRDLAKRDCTIHLITAREERHRNITETWLNNHQIPYHSLTMSPVNQSYSKGKRCQELGVQFFVDDKIENAVDVANQDVYTLLFHASHNLNHQTGLPLVKSWLEVQEHIHLFFEKRLREAR